MDGSQLSNGSRSAALDGPARQYVRGRPGRIGRGRANASPTALPATASITGSQTTRKGFRTFLDEPTLTPAKNAAMFATLGGTINQLLRAGASGRAHHDPTKDGNWNIATVAIGRHFWLRSSGNYMHSVAGLADSWLLPTNSISSAGLSGGRPCELDLPQRRRS